MSDTRLAQARDEAWKRYPEGWDPYNEEPVDDWGYSECQREAFRAGVEWADAHPYSTPEDLVAAYEEGQRDAVEKGLTKVRVTADQCNDIEDAVHEGVPLGRMLRRLPMRRAVSEPIELIDWDEEGDAIEVPTDCAACGQPAEGFAMINDQRYCHPDEGPSCYMGGQA